MMLSDSFLKEGKCKEKVNPKEAFGFLHPHQCHHNIWKDGFCKTHHSDTVKARQEARQKEWQEKIKDILLLDKANEKIKELERQLESSNQIREAEKKILIEEIEKNKALKESLDALEQRY